jgi:REP element-mobilizing transposase RayT
MSVRRQISEKEGIYFITFTCYNWMPLIEIVNGYDIIYKQFDYLKSCGHYIVGYTIMPNHAHAVIAFRNTGKSINSIMGNMKRFMAYEIVERLAKQNRKDILQKLAGGVNAADKKKGQLHQVFEPSFDAKDYYNDKNIL